MFKEQASRLWKAISGEIIAYEPGNCVGFAFYRLGISSTDRFIDPFDLEWLMHYFVEVENLESAQALAFVVPETKHLNHLAVINADNSGVLEHRPGIGAKIEQIPLWQELAIRGYSPVNKVSNDYSEKIVYLKVKSR
jgi:hypothetical protein